MTRGKGLEKAGSTVRSPRTAYARKKQASRGPQKQETNGSARDLRWKAGLYSKIGCLLSQDGTPAGDDFDGYLQTRETAIELLAAFTDGKADTKKAHAILASGIDAFSEIFFDEATAENNVLPLLLGDGIIPPPVELLSIDELKGEVRRIVSVAMRAAPAQYQRRLERYGLAGALIRRVTQSASMAPAVLEAWRKHKRVSLDDLPGVWWTDDAGLDVLFESAAFECAKWRPMWCRHGNHLFLADYRRRLYCRAHRRAGWQRTYNENKKKKGEHPTKKRG